MVEINLERRGQTEKQHLEKIKRRRVVESLFSGSERGMHANVQTMTISDGHLTQEEKAHDREPLLNTDHCATLTVL